VAALEQLADLRRSREAQFTEAAAQQRQRMAAEREAGALVVGDDVGALGRHGEQRRRFIHPHISKESGLGANAGDTPVGAAAVFRQCRESARRSKPRRTAMPWRFRSFTSCAGA